MLPHVIFIEKQNETKQNNNNNKKMKKKKPQKTKTNNNPPQKKKKKQRNKITKQTNKNILKVLSAPLGHLRTIKKQRICGIYIFFPSVIPAGSYPYYCSNESYVIGGKYVVLQCKSHYDEGTHTLLQRPL